MRERTRRKIHYRNCEASFFYIIKGEQRERKRKDILIDPPLSLSLSFNKNIQLLAVDTSASRTMKNAAKCDNSCELHSQETH